jgi:hypothetical protein
MQHRKIVTAISVLLLSACTSTTGVIQIGQDTYMIGSQGKSPGGFSGTEAKALAFADAQRYCAGLGKKVQVINTQQSDMAFGKNATAEVQFMCLSEGDPQLGRPRLEKVPDQVIQVNSPLAPQPPSSTQMPRDLYSELLKLEDLKKRGLLSDLEFEQQKKRLLSNQ